MSGRKKDSHISGKKGKYIRDDKGNIIDATGGKRAAMTNKERYGEDYYKEMGARGGAAPHFSPKGFAANPVLASRAGRKGGLKSKRGKKQ
jgi:general stress protein YciG